MNKLKEIGNKYYQECEVVMLDSNNKSYFGFLTKKGKEVFNDLRYFNMEMPQILDSVNQHIYFLSNEEIKEDDWCIFMYDLAPKYGICKGRNIQDKSLAKKIITTTDTSLGLPQPSKSFIQAYIKAYNEGKPITKVLIEYEIKNISDDEGFFNLTERIKINSSNEITIKKVKNSYTQQEVDDLLDRNTCQITALMLEKFKGYKSREEVIQILVDYSNNLLNQRYRGNTTEVINQFIEENL